MTSITQQAEHTVLGVLGGIQKRMAPALEGVVRSELLSLGVAVVVRGRRSLSARAERSSRHFLHAMNLPAGSDIRRLLAQGAMIERRVQEMSKLMEDIRDREEIGRGVS